MIIYQNTKANFIDDILTNQIETIIEKAFRNKLQAKTSINELRSWKNSLQYMNNVLVDEAIPGDCHVSVEYRIPQTSKRIDFIITGQDESGKDHALIIELKQWQSAGITAKDAVVTTWLGKTEREVSHPSYQAWSYAALLQGFNETVYEENIELKPCAYLHNYERDGIIDNEFYADYIQKAPLFLRADAIALRRFIKKYIRYGDKHEIMYRIDAGKIRPSKSLADSLHKMLKGNQEFILIDDQKIVFETAMTLARKSSNENKNLLIVEGGPGTGKTVVAINLLVQLTKAGLLTQYVTKNAAPRAVYESKLTGTIRKSHISNMFKGSGAYVAADPNSFDCLIVDEAHRLNEKSGLYGNLGENQILEIIRSSKFSIFFIDENQRVTLADIGQKSEIKAWASQEGVKVYKTELSSQFRCNGSDGYLAWLDNLLQIRETANDVLDSKDYDFRVCADPNELRALIIEKNNTKSPGVSLAKANKSRLVAGYCWDWNSKKNPKSWDIVLPEFDFQMRWNLVDYGSCWLIDTESISEVGCIHTCQGLELEYIGVIIGPDMVVRNGQIVTDATKRAKGDKSIFGWKKKMLADKETTTRRLDELIKNTYRTLMTRGMKGCYVWSVDLETNEWLLKMAGQDYKDNNELAVALAAES
jgi:uncharacterized protein